MTELHTSESGPRWRPYPAYKDSGVPWLGKIPAHWEVKRLKNVAKLNPEVLPETTDPDSFLSG
jgi:type I restriction enzyme S subunit